MNILVIMKRFSSGKDQIAENFGREVRLASELQRLGNSVTVLCADQAKKERLIMKLNGMTVEIYPFGILKVLGFLATAKKMAAQNDIIIGTSHPLLGIIAVMAAKGKPVVYDIRDNYETYALIKLPLLSKLMIRLVNNTAIKKSSLVVCGSNILAEMAKKTRNGPITVVPNGVNLKLYKPIGKEKCRKMLGLPLKDKIIAYSGGIRGAGVDVLISAFHMLEDKDKKLKLMLIGNELKSRYAETASASKGRITVEGSMPYGRLLYYLNSADAFVISYEPNDFTNIMYAPYKLVDYMALNKPIVCTDVGEMRKMLKGHEQLVCRPNDAEDMAQKIMAALKTKKANYRERLKEFTWERLGEKLNDAIKAMFKNRARGN